MYSTRILMTVIFWIAPFIHALSRIDPRSEEFNIDGLYDFLEIRNENVIIERDVSSIESIIQAVNDSGIILKIISNLADSDEQLDSVCNLTESILKNGSGGLNTSSLNLNLTTILQAVNDSGIIFSLIDGLLLDDTNREYVTTVVGEIIRYNPWITKLLYDLGAGKKLTIDFIADLIQNFTSKDPSFQPSSHYTFTQYNTVVFGKRDDTEGTAQAFLDNLISTVTGSSLVYSSVNDFLVALNQSGVAESTALQVLNDSNVYYILTYVSTKLYSDGALDNIDLNHYFSEAKESGLLSNSIQSLVTNKKYGPAVGLLLKQLEDTGVMKSMQRTLYGDV